MVADAIDALSERFRMFFISELLTILMFLPVSMIDVVRMPISLTVPRKPFTSTMSPTLYWFSNSMKNPVTTSAIRLSAPKPITSARMPTLVTIVLTSTPKSERPPAEDHDNGNVFRQADQQGENGFTPVGFRVEAAKEQLKQLCSSKNARCHGDDPEHRMPVKKHVDQ